MGSLSNSPRRNSFVSVAAHSHGMRRPKRVQLRSLASAAHSLFDERRAGSRFAVLLQAL